MWTTDLLSDRRFTEHSSANSRVVHAPTVRIAEPPKNGGVNPDELSSALSSGGKGKKQKAYRRSVNYSETIICRLHVSFLFWN